MEEMRMHKEFESGNLTGIDNLGDLCMVREIINGS
jgi:hypothetical protein